MRSRGRSNPRRMNMKTLAGTWAICLLVASTGLGSGAYDDWFNHFYQTHDISKFEGFWNEVVTQKHLENDTAIAPLTGFISQVLHQHPSLLKNRFDDLGEFPEAQRRAVANILWLSSTPEADEILEKNKDKEFLHQPHLPIGAWPIKTASDLDFCWGYYFASGDTDALIPIVTSLDLVQYAGAIKKLNAGHKTEADTANAHKEAIFAAAVWSLGSNAKSDPKVARYLDTAYENSPAPFLRKLCMRTVLSKVYPDKYEVVPATEKMTKVVFRAVGPGIPPDSFAAKPKTLYRVGKTKSRTEEAPDPSMNLHGLIISNGPDIWMINLMDYKARHIMDPGPTYGFHAPIVPSNQKNKPPRVKAFEIGKELAFMEENSVKPTKAEFDGHEALRYECVREGLTLTLFVSPLTRAPLASTVNEAGKELVRYVYDKYTTDLAYDDKLFWPPAGVVVTEDK